MTRTYRKYPNALRDNASLAVETIKIETTDGMRHIRPSQKDRKSFTSQIQSSKSTPDQAVKALVEKYLLKNEERGVVAVRISGVSLDFDNNLDRLRKSNLHFIYTATDEPVNFGNSIYKATNLDKAKGYFGGRLFADDDFLVRIELKMVCNRVKGNKRCREKRNARRDHQLGRSKVSSKPGKIKQYRNRKYDNFMPELSELSVIANKYGEMSCGLATYVCTGGHHRNRRVFQNQRKGLMFEMQVDPKMVPHIVGKGGACINRIRLVSGAYIKLLGHDLTIIGKQDQIAVAVAEINLVISKRSVGKKVKPHVDYKAVDATFKNFLPKAQKIDDNFKMDKQEDHSILMDKDDVRMFLVLDEVELYATQSCKDVVGRIDRFSIATSVSISDGGIAHFSKPCQGFCSMFSSDLSQRFHRVFLIQGSLYTSSQTSRFESLEKAMDNFREKCTDWTCFHWFYPTGKFMDIVGERIQNQSMRFRPMVAEKTGFGVTVHALKKTELTINFNSSLELIVEIPSHDGA